MLLSIVMMIKNEEKYLDKTLSSLMPLMKDINSELIILDTGSTDRSIDISKKYTDKIYFSEWNDNFGEMRNVSISYAKGDWILILDADEELVNHDKMIKFLKSDLCNKYNCASIELKSIFSEDKNTYDRSSILRLFKNDEEFEYRGSIHEQPIFKEPIFNDIAYFNHYGYMYENEEIKQKKLARNEKILLSEIKLNPNDPYIYYQLAKNYTVYGDKEEALSYMIQCCDMYNKLGITYIPAQSGLAKLYIEIGEYEKCESLCQHYIKRDDKNIDIYCYIALSQNYLKKYNESLKNYNKYVYLIDNYEISTQANDVCCSCETISFRESAEIDIVKIYYNLEMYEKVVSQVQILKSEQLRPAYLELFMSLYKLNKENQILNIYNENSNSLVDKKELKLCLEKMILKVKQSDREKIYSVLSCINDNYGILNQIRLGKRLSDKECNEIIIKEKEVYYADLIYYGFKKGSDLLNILQGVSNVYIQKYFDYIIHYKRDCILDMYNYLLKVPNTLDLNKLSIYSSLSKSLLLDGNLKDEKYENLFLLYITYNYDYLSQVYNNNIADEELLRYITDEEEIFIINIIIIQKLKRNNKLEYIKKMRELLIDNQHHKKGIEILIDKFKKEFNESEELKELKEKYKSIIEKNIQLGNINICIDMINECEDIFDEDEISNIKAIINIYTLNFEKADSILKISYIKDRYDYNVIFNIAYLKEKLADFEDAKRFYTEAIKLNCDLKVEIEERLDNLGR